jgi:hypothetical protein
LRLLHDFGAAWKHCFFRATVSVASSNNATTVHKLQGATLEKLFVSSWSCQKSWVHVVLSRATATKGPRARHKLAKQGQKNRCGTVVDCRLDSRLVDMVERFRQKLSPKPWKHIASASSSGAGSSGGGSSPSFSVETIRHKVKNLRSLSGLDKLCALQELDQSLSQMGHRPKGAKQRRSSNREPVLSCLRHCRGGDECKPLEKSGINFPSWRHQRASCERRKKAGAL